MANPGRPSKGERGKFQMRLPEDTLVELKHYSFDKGEPLGDIVSRVVFDWWAQQPERQKYQNLREPAPKPTPKKNGSRAKEA